MLIILILIIIIGVIIMIIMIIRQGRQHSVVGTILTTFLQLLGFDQNQIGSRALDMVRLVIIVMML